MSFDNNFYLTLLPRGRQYLITYVKQMRWLPVHVFMRSISHVKRYR